MNSLFSLLAVTGSETKAMGTLDIVLFLVAVDPQTELRHRHHPRRDRSFGRNFQPRRDTHCSSFYDFRGFARTFHPRRDVGNYVS